MKAVVLTIALFVTVGLLVGCGKEADKVDEHEHSAVEHSEELPAGANVMCPVMPEEKVDPELYVEHKGKRIYVCCKKCAKQVQEDPAGWYTKAYGDN